MTLNTWKNEGEYRRRLHLMSQALAALEPDVVCLQECFAGAGLDTASSLAGDLGLDLNACPARAKPRLHEGECVASTSRLAILSRPTAIGSGVLPLESHPADGERVAQRLDLTVEDHPLRILNLHLTHLHGPRFDRLRARQLEAALAWASETPIGGLVVAGDLNAGAREPALAPLNAEAGAFEAATFLGPRADGPEPVSPAIDHLILQTPGKWRVAARFRALDRGDADGWRPSDHAAVVVDLAAA